MIFSTVLLLFSETVAHIISSLQPAAVQAPLSNDLLTVLMVFASSSLNIFLLFIAHDTTRNPPIQLGFLINVIRLTN